jgi:DNA-binding response OmpR family regulator
MSAPTVLIVDDEGYIQRILTYVLQAEGFEVLTAADGEEAVQQVKENHPDAVILDLMLPAMDGYQVLQIIRQDDAMRNTPVLVLSAKGRDLDRDTAIKAGASDYITKPFSPQRLVDRLQEMLAAGKS